MHFENQGVPRTGGRILGLLLVANEPLSAEDLASILQVSRAGISTNIRLLVSSGLVEKISFPGRRTVHFAFSDAAWEQVMQVEIRSAAAFRNLVEQALNALPAAHPARTRLEKTMRWVDFATRYYQQMLEAWRARH